MREQTSLEQVLVTIVDGDGWRQGIVEEDTAYTLFALSSGRPRQLGVDAGVLATVLYPGHCCLPRATAASINAPRPRGSSGSVAHRSGGLSTLYPSACCWAPAGPNTRRQRFTKWARAPRTGRCRWRCPRGGSSSKTPPQIKFRRLAKSRATALAPIAACSTARRCDRTWQTGSWTSPPAGRWPECSPTTVEDCTAWSIEVHRDWLMTPRSDLGGPDPAFPTARSLRVAPDLESPSTHIVSMNWALPPPCPRLTCWTIAAQ